MCISVKRNELTHIYYILINEILRNIDEIICVFSFSVFHFKKFIFNCSKTYFPYLHWCPVGRISSKLSQYTKFKGKSFKL
jgi:hypothetical protein